MNEAELTTAYLDLFQKNWRDPSLVEDLQKLRMEAERGGLNQWTRIIEARIARTENRFDDALQILDSLLQEAPESPHAAFLKGSILLEVPGREADALIVLDALIARLASAADLPSQQVLAVAMRNKCVTLVRMEKRAEALAAYEAVIDRFRDASELPLREAVARAMCGKGWTLGRMEKYAEALPAYEAVIARFRDAAELPLREEVAQAMFGKGWTLGRMEKYAEALPAYEAVIEQFRDAVELPLREQVAKAMVNKGNALGRMDKHAEALAAYDAVIEGFGTATEAQLASLCDRARRLKAILVEPKGGPAAKEAKETAIKTTEGKYSENLRMYLDLALAHFDRATLDGYLRRIRDSENDTNEFLSPTSRFAVDSSFILILREWNSFTPALPAEGESDRGGGYFIRHAGTGIVVDPGYDFIENFYRAGGRLRDIDHVCITHAHDDHTAELESLLMLLHRYNRENQSRDLPRKRISIYMSQACHRKFSGLVPLRDDPRLDRIVTLARPWDGCLQMIKLTDKVTLTVLPAYHDDVLTRDTALGLEFRFGLDEGQSRRVVFTGDTGYYPRLAKPEGGEGGYYDAQRRRPKVDTADGNGIDSQYASGRSPGETQAPDLLVAHIGSIQEQEFVPWNTQTSTDREEGEWYYANHLGLLGTLTLLDRLAPHAAIISEFGAELKGFHIELVDRIGEALRDKQSRTPGGPQTVVFPGDLTMVYYIAEDKFLCHEDGKAHAARDLTCHATDEWKVKASGRHVPDLTRNGAQRRAHLCLSKPTEKPDERGIRDYYENRFRGKLPHFRDAS